MSIKPYFQDSGFYRKAKPCLFSLIFLITFTTCEKDDTKDDKKVDLEVLAERGAGLEFVTQEQQEDLAYGAPPSTVDNLPERYDFQDKMPPVGNQGSQGSCVGFSTGYAIKSYHEFIENGYSYTDASGNIDYDHVMSPAYIFNQIGNTSCTSAHLKDAMEMLMNEGVSNWSEMPYTSSGCSVNPSSTARDNATSHKIGSYSFVSPTDINQIKAHLVDDKPVSIGIEFDTAFWVGDFPKIDGQDVYQNYIKNDFVGGHALTVCGYDDDFNAFLVMNSWGSSWGNNGYIWIDYGVFPTVTHEAYVTTDVGSGGHWRLYSLDNYVVGDKVYYTAVWRPGNQGEYQIYNASRNDFMAYYNDRIVNGYRLHILNSFVVNNQVRHTAVFKPGNEQEYWVIDYKYADYRAKYDEMWAAGWRLHLLNCYVVNNEVLYTAVWKIKGGGEYQIYGATRQQFVDYYNQKVSEGFRLDILSSYYHNGEMRHTAVFKPGNVAEQWVLDYKYADYRKKYDELWNQGYRLHYLDNYVVNGDVLYAAIFKPGSEAEIQVYGWDYQNYRKQYDGMW